MTPEIALLSESPQAEVRVSLPQEPLDDNDDTGVETFILLLNDELGLAPANVFLGQSVVNIEDTGKRIIRCGRNTGKRRSGMILYNVVSCRQASITLWRLLCSHSTYTAGKPGNEASLNSTR